MIKLESLCYDASIRYEEWNSVGLVADWGIQVIVAANRQVPTRIAPASSRCTGVKDTVVGGSLHLKQHLDGRPRGDSYACCPNAQVDARSVGSSLAGRRGRFTDGSRGRRNRPIKGAEVVHPWGEAVNRRFLKRRGQWSGVRALRRRCGER